MLLTLAAKFDDMRFETAVGIATKHDACECAWIEPDRRVRVLGHDDPVLTFIAPHFSLPMERLEVAILPLLAINPIDMKELGSVLCRPEAPQNCGGTDGVKL